MTGEFPQLKIAIDKFGKEYIQELTKNLLQADKKASGRLIRSLDYDVIEVVNGIYLEILSEPYLINVDQGRRPGLKPPPVSAIIPWVKDRKIKGRDKKGRFITDRSLAFIIARGIGKNGIRSTNVIAFTNKVMRNRAEVLSRALGKDVMLSLNKILSEI